MSSLWYSRPASVWQEALPIGNGRLGAMIFGGVRRERIQLNEDTLWGGSPYNPAVPQARKHLHAIQQSIFDGRYDDADEIGNTSFMGAPPRQPAYQPVGDLYIEMHGVPEVIPMSYRRELSLDSAAVTVQYTYRDTVYTRRYVASPANQVITVFVTSSRPGGLDLNLFANSPQAHQLTIDDNGGLILMTGRNSPENGLAGGLGFQMRCKVIARDGAVSSTGDQCQVRNASEVTLFIAIATSFRNYHDVTADFCQLATGHIDGCAGLTFDDIAQSVRVDHSRLFHRVHLDFGVDNNEKPTDQRLQEFKLGASDPSLIALYFQFGRYLLIASSRPGSQAANLQGIWNDSLDPGWGCGYTININTQMNYWLAEPTGLPEMVEPLVRLVEDIAQTGSAVAKVMYGAEGWVCHQNTDLWRATAPNTGAQWSLWPTGGAWLCRHLWDHYDYNRDKAFLRRVFPVLAGACRFFLCTMIEDPVSGYMVTNPSCSPENIHGINGSSTTLCPGPTMDMQILRDLFSHTIDACRILHEDESLQQSLETLRSRLRPTTLGADGRINEWPDHLAYTEPEPDHRHTSHLFGLYPAHQITPDTTPQLAEGCAYTLLQRGDPGTGWASAWRLNLWSRLGDASKAWDMLKVLLCEMTYSNLFDIHPPLSKAYAMGTFQIDGNLGGTAGIAEMLVQSRGDEIILLPALPSQHLPQGSFMGIRLRGRWSMDLEWRGAKLRRVHLRSDLAGQRIIRYGLIRRSVAMASGESITLFGTDLSDAEV